MFFSTIHSRIRIVIIGCIVLISAVIIRVLYIQLIEYKKLSKLAGDLWNRNLPIEADRGIIYDRNGVVLADNITTTSLIVVPNQIKNKEVVSKALSEILGVSYEEIYRHVSKRVSIERIHPEGRRLDYETANKINSLNFDGVYLLKEAKRNYPYDKYMSHVIGFVGIDNQGLSGLELQYDKYLKGENGAIKYFSDAKGNRLQMTEIYEQPQSGINMMLTIDHKIQTSIERELDNVVSKYMPDNALAIAMNPNTGEILGMSSRPNFSPSNYQKYTVEEINRNLPIWATYEPGSTFKIITLASAIQEGKVDLDKDMFYDSGHVRVENARIRCWKSGGHGSQTFLQVVENSCNPGFVELGQRLGKETLFKYLDDFGFGKKTGIDLNGEGTGIIFKLDRVGPVELATTAFGQGVSVTPIQQITAVSAAINGGYLYQPYIVKRLLEPETNTIVQENDKKMVRQVIDESTSMKVRYALESVVSNGTGRNSYIEGYRVGGKTGTAQKVSGGRYMVGNYIVSFIGFLPADNPEIVVYVAIDYPKGITQYGGTVAAPVAKAIMLDAIDALNIKRREDGSEMRYNWYDKKYYTVPNVIGMNKTDAIKELKRFQIEYSGSGKKVLDQSPQGGTKIYEGEKVRLFLSDQE
ncbi:MAG TPA: stage V sporulation protein D [Mollicutes bacterium]|nr:stage V sporulation protein D [Mollicutes bacterium]